MPQKSWLDDIPEEPDWLSSIPHETEISNHTIPDRSMMLQEPSRLRQAWDFGNTPVIDMLTDDKTKQAEALFAQEHPYLSMIGQTAKSLTSPISLGLGALSGAGAVASKLGMTRLADLLEVPGRAAGAGMIGHGMYQAGTGETTPERVAGALEATAGVFGARTPEKIKIKTDPKIETKIEPSIKIEEPPVTETWFTLPEKRSGTPPYNTAQFGLRPGEPVTDPLMAHVPNRLRPPSTNAIVFDALVPESLKINEQGAARPLTTAVEHAEPQSVTRIVSDNPIISKIDDVVDEVQSPELAKAVEDPTFYEKYISPLIRTNPASRFAAKMGSAVKTELSKLHPLLGDLVERTRVDSEIKAGTWMTRYDNIVKNIGEKDFQKLVGAIEGRVRLDPSADSKLVTALEEMKVLNQEVINEAQASGMGLKSPDGSKLIPWQPRDNYWPHMYTDEFFSEMKNNPLKLKAELMAKGMAPAEVDALFSNSRRFGERLIDAQHAREANMPGYRTDKNVYREHLEDMGKRITEATNYGPMDLADPNSPLVNLIKQSKNPEYASSLMSKILNRDKFADPDANILSRKVVGLQAWMHLATSGIGNLNTIAMVPIQTNVSSFLKGLTQTVMQSQATREFAQSSGAIQNIFKEIFAAASKGHSFTPSKVYGLDAEERFMRTLSAASGKAYAKQLFNDIKGGNVNQRSLQRLQDLILDGPTKFMSQTELSDQQLKRAAFRTAELTQGLATNLDLPHYWTGSSLSNILTLFHKYQFAQTKIVKDLIMSNPVRNIPLLFGASQIAGEITGDLKAALTGGIRAGISGDTDKLGDQIANRGQFWQDKFGADEVTARMIENANQSFALGIYADVLEAMGGTGTDLLKRMAGSTINDLIRVFDIGRKAASGKLSSAGTDAIGMVPVVGPPLRQELREQ